MPSWLLMVDFSSLPQLWVSIFLATFITSLLATVAYEVSA